MSSPPHGLVAGESSTDCFLRCGEKANVYAENNDGTNSEQTLENQNNMNSPAKKNKNESFINTSGGGEFF